MNDLFIFVGSAENRRILMYADDMVLYVTGPNLRDSVVGCQLLLSKLVDWCKINKLTIDTSKTKHMFIPKNQTQRELTKDLNVNIAQEKPHNVTSYKYLGVDLDQTLSFDTMIDTMYKKANRKLYSLKNIRPYITNSVASLISKTCVRPVVEYADFLVDSSNKKTGRLTSIQKRAVKIIDQARHKEFSYEELLILYGIEDLVMRRKKHHLSVMYRQSQDDSNPDTYRPETDLRSNLKIRFRNKTTQLT